MHQPDSNTIIVHGHTAEIEGSCPLFLAGVIPVAEQGAENHERVFHK